jgi:hypothetical protein
LTQISWITDRNLRQSALIWTNQPVQPPLLEVDNPSRHFGGLAALDGVSFGVAGHAVRADRPQRRRQDHADQRDQRAAGTSGVRLAGASLTGLPPHAIARRGVARTFQNIRLFKELSVLENVMLGGHLREQGNLLEIVLRLPSARAAQRARRSRLHIEHRRRWPGAPTATSAASDRAWRSAARAALDEPAGMVSGRGRWSLRASASRCWSSNTTWT